MGNYLLGYSDMGDILGHYVVEKKMQSLEEILPIAKKLLCDTLYEYAFDIEKLEDFAESAEQARSAIFEGVIYEERTFRYESKRVEDNYPEELCELLGSFYSQIRIKELDEHEFLVLDKYRNEENFYDAIEKRWNQCDLFWLEERIGI